MCNARGSLGPRAHTYSVDNLLYGCTPLYGYDSA